MPLKSLDTLALYRFLKIIISSYELSLQLSQVLVEALQTCLFSEQYSTNSLLPALPLFLLLALLSVTLYCVYVMLDNGKWLVIDMLQSQTTIL